MWGIIKLKYGMQILKLFPRDIVFLCPFVGYVHTTIPLYLQRSEPSHVNY